MLINWSFQELGVVVGVRYVCKPQMCQKRIEINTIQRYIDYINSCILTMTNDEEHL